ncbi:GH15 family glucan-1,4-alpha-glucosidase [Hamadaea flava]|uniref:Glycoside hydrolase family 15 protein n=1 Tax=Hamadaea flava TaxID=1742688 RepID=A0ABV8LWU5_9ACTN|nr:glycoside hydrolase family 15 protein [Hamadaea flava]MCP2324520.1 GH15 family glucan-1,4-alpha-glucosidase [Hamadaea flava]
MQTAVAASVELIARHQHSGGAYPASPTYPVYGYCWLRDGSFIADAMSRAGRTASADAFHGWCARVIEGRGGHVAELVAAARRGEEIDPRRMLPTRYTLDGGDGDEPWWDYQLDGYGTWLWALVEHTRRHGGDLAPYRAAIITTVDYLATFGADPCYDWWEEHAEHRHVATLGSVAAGLDAVLSADLLDEDRTKAATQMLARLRELIAGPGTVDGSLVKWLGSGSVDGGLLACLTPFGLVTPEVAEGTYQRVRTELRRNGVYRYLGDTFYGGGEWLILTAWLGWHEARTGRAELARERLAWVAAQATPEGWLPEQVSGDTQDPAYIAEWTAKWGPVATPLLWSHALFVILALELGESL